ncbi:iron-containing alcohol dehydrogenase family protein [Amycolatopsis sp. NPDC051903]|uniref:iron-containing alcohol dehydrogenase family protein n=1 Tax=Amycolatopsis sp. NPDC051903 TaxID=3363936 RepID=UPI0037BC3138
MARTEFGPGMVERLPEFIGEHGARVFVVTDRGLRATGIVGRVETIFAKAGVECAVHEDIGPNPATTELDRGAARLREFGPAVVVALGGGSALDAAKGISLLAGNPGAEAADADALWDALDGRPIIAVPTTSGTGAETNGFGVVEDVVARRKVYIGHSSVVPRIAVLDPELTLGLPAAITAATGLDALVHGVESLASRGADSESAAHATRAVALVGEWLPVAFRDGTNLEARAQLMLGAHLAGHALTRSGLGLVHGLGHAITARTGTPHGVALAAVLEEVMRFSAEAAAGPYAQVADALHAQSAVDAVGAISGAIGIKRPLRDLGLTREDLPAVAQAALADAVTKNTPKAPHQAEVEELLASVY